MLKAAAPATAYRRIYHCRADQLRQVRRDLAGYLAECPLAENAVFVVHELAANAILHSQSKGGFFRVRVMVNEDHVRIECEDEGGPWRPRKVDDERPHGLDMVAAYTGPDGWGTIANIDGSRIVWARLKLSAQEQV